MALVYWRGDCRYERGQKHLFFLRGARTWESRRKSTPSHTASRAVSCVASNLDVARTCAHAVSASGYATFSAAEFSSGSLGRVKEKGSERKGNARRKVGTWRESVILKSIWGVQDKFRLSKSRLKLDVAQ